MLDREFGYDVIKYAKLLNETLKLNLCFVTLSSTEDKDTQNKYSNVGTLHFYPKPLNKNVLTQIIEKLDSYKSNQDKFNNELLTLKNELKIDCSKKDNLTDFDAKTRDSKNESQNKNEITSSEIEKELSTIVKESVTNKDNEIIFVKQDLD